MFDKILIEEGKIRFAQWSIGWKEKRVFKTRDGNKEILVPRLEWGVGEDRKNEIAARLAAQETEYTIETLEIPEELLKFEGKEWSGSRGEAIQLINEEPEYIIDALRKKLSAEDYKHVRQQREREILAQRGDFTLTMSESEYTAFCIDQESAVQKIREMEEKLVSQPKPTPFQRPGFPE